MLNKPFYMSFAAVFLVLFIVTGSLLYMQSDANTLPDIQAFSLPSQEGALNTVSAFTVQLLSGVFTNSLVTFVFNMLCILFSTYFVFEVLRVSITKELAFVMSALFLLIARSDAVLLLGGPLCCLLSSFVVYLYYLKYDGRAKWYIIELCLACLCIHSKVFLVALYLFPLAAYRKIREQKTAWTGFVNMIILLLVAFAIHFGFVNNFPVTLFNGNIKWWYGIMSLTYPQYTRHFVLLCIMVFMIIFSLIGILFTKKFIKGYVKFVISYFVLLLLSFAVFGIDGEILIAFLPPIFIGFSSVLCHLPLIRRYRKTFTVIILVLTTVLFLFI